MPRTIEDAFAADPAFWTPGQRAALAAARELCGMIPPGYRAALEWKRQRGGAFEAWLRLSKSERRRWMASHLEVSDGS